LIINFFIGKTRQSDG